MSIEPYIINDIEMADISSRVGDIQSEFDGLTYSHIPVKNEEVYVGCISENDIRSFDPNKSLSDFQYALEGFYTRRDDNWLDVLHAFAKNDTNILPVLDEDNSYLGYVELHDIMNLFTESPFLNNPGGIFILEKGIRDYSFSEISQIVESNGAHLLGAFVSSLENDLAQITLKIGPSPVNAILQTFRRYGYKVTSTHMEDSFSSNLKDRSRYLDKYLNM
ncbi:CBS domain-containing protein [Salinimicrobium gaetbulicola]|uniref:CBS domain-containing protein n=1 Tax=Salinimicrobium gaetbulicola TaxID=999702 RepID=A0ABW3IES9_9FLAO